MSYFRFYQKTKIRRVAILVFKNKVLRNYSTDNQKQVFTSVHGTVSVNTWHAESLNF